MIALYVGDLPGCFGSDERLVSIWEAIEGLRILGQTKHAVEMLQIELSSNLLNENDEMCLRFMLANSCCRTGKYETALDTLDCDTDSRQLDVRFLLQTTKAYVFQCKDRRSEDAAKILESLSDLIMTENVEPIRWDDVLIELAVIHSRNGSLDSAVAGLERIIASPRAEPINVACAFKYMIIRVFQKNGTVSAFRLAELSVEQLEEIELLYTKMLEHPQLQRFYLQILQDRGDFYLSVNQIEKGIRDYTAALDTPELVTPIWPAYYTEHPKLIRKRARAYELLGNIEAAQQDTLWAEQIEKEKETDNNW